MISSRLDIPFPDKNNSLVTIKETSSREVEEKSSERVASGNNGTFSEPPSVITYPDGGLRSWGIVLGGFFAQFGSYGFIDSFGVYQDYYTRTYLTEHSPSAISWIGSVASFLAFSTGLIGGRLYDKGHCMHLLYGGSFLMSLSMFMLSFVKPNQYYGVFLCQGIGIGIGAGMTYVPSSALVSQYFDKKRTVAMSIITAGVSFGSALLPIMINQLLAKPSLNFAIVMRIVAGFMTTILAASCILMRPRLPPAEKHANVVVCLKRFSKDRAYIALTLGFMAFALGFLFPMFYLQLAATTHGLDKTFTFYSLVILNGCGFIARLLCGFISQKFRLIHLAIASSIVCGCVALAFVAIGSAASVIIVGVLYGSASGIYVGTTAPLITLLTDNEAELGLRLGIAYTASGLGELTGSPIAGALLTSEYHWWRPAIFSGMLLLTAAGCFTIVNLIAKDRIQR